ncbi:hypothetical protein C1645_735166 [Glomus cerebriforme]|uniref:Uncharacterized protein n=1 Tax=Glomus cerebriforme TaxID=658196 RepID=A0A397TGA1_9GLOM|nr:hypothetical protein C1645_735166 [Glomus cerebriforme]
MGWDNGIWDGIWDGMGCGILPFPLIWAASLSVFSPIKVGTVLQALRSKMGGKMFDTGIRNDSPSSSVWNGKGNDKFFRKTYVLSVFDLILESKNKSGFFSISAWKSDKFQSCNFETFFLECLLLDLGNQNVSFVTFSSGNSESEKKYLALEMETETNILTKCFFFFIGLLLDLGYRNKYMNQ